MRKTTLLPLVVALCAATALAEDPKLPPAIQLAAEAKALCEAQTVQPVAECVRETLGDDGVESLKQAIDAEHRKLSDAFYTEIAEQLLKRDEPRATLLGARLLRMTVDFHRGGPRQDEAAKATRLRIGELVRAAALRAEDDILMQWTLAGEAFRREQPDLSSAAVERLRERDPDNLAVFFLGDMADVWSTTRVQQASATQRFDLPYFDLMHSDLELLASYEVPRWVRRVPGQRELESIEAHQFVVLGLQMAESIPAMRGLTLACLPNREGWRSEHRPYCERIARVLAYESNTLIGWNIGVALLEGLADTPEKRAVAEAARRTYRYQTEQAFAAQRSDEGLKAWTKAMREPGVNEVELIRQQLRERGLPDQPPDDWQPRTYEEQQAQWAADRAKQRE